MGMHTEVANLYMEEKKKMLKNFTFLKVFDLNLFTHYSIFIALFFSIFSTLCSHQPPMVHQGHKKKLFFSYQNSWLWFHEKFHSSHYHFLAFQKKNTMLPTRRRKQKIYIMEETGVILYFK